MGLLSSTPLGGFRCVNFGWFVDCCCSHGCRSLGFEQIASDGLKGRVFEVSLADLQQDEDQAFRKIKLRAEDVQGRNVLTNFWVRLI